MFELEDDPKTGKLGYSCYFEEALDGEVGFVCFSPEDDLMLAATDRFVYLFSTKKKSLFKKLDFEVFGPHVPRRCVFAW